METILIFLAIVIGVHNTGDILESKRREERHTFRVNQVIYRYENYMDGKGKIVRVVSNGVGTCRGWRYQKLRAPFMAKYKMVEKEGELDSCTGEVFTGGQWIQGLTEYNP